MLSFGITPAFYWRIILLGRSEPKRAEGYRLMDHEGTGIPARGNNYGATLLLVQTLFGWVCNSDEDH